MEWNKMSGDDLTKNHVGKKEKKKEKPILVKVQNKIKENRNMESGVEWSGRIVWFRKEKKEKNLRGGEVGGLID